jgi:Flp pilus assembly protein TadB
MRSRPSGMHQSLPLLLLLLLSPGTVLAYVDPNAGGQLLQLLAPVFAAIAGAWLFLRRWLADVARRWWHRLTRRPD